VRDDATAHLLSASSVRLRLTLEQPPDSIFGDVE